MPPATLPRAASLALAVCGSILLLAGLVVPGLLVGLAAVGAAWIRPSARHRGDAADGQAPEPAGRSTP